MFNSTSFTLTINSSFIIYLVILYFQQLPLLFLQEATIYVS